MYCGWEGWVRARGRHTRAHTTQARPASSQSESAYELRASQRKQLAHPHLVAARLDCEFVRLPAPAVGDKSVARNSSSVGTRKHHRHFMSMNLLAWGRVHQAFSPVYALSRPFSLPGVTSHEDLSPTNKPQQPRAYTSHTTAFVLRSVAGSAAQPETGGGGRC